MKAVVEPSVRTDAPIPTWFGVGGVADAFAEPATVDELQRLIERFEGRVRVLGDGANLLVDDAGADGLVVSLKRLDAVASIHAESDPAGAGIHAGAGVMLPRLIVQAVREGLGGLEGLGGVPATLGGAVRMNAGGAFGEMAPVVRAVRGVTLAGQPFDRTGETIPFGYRESGLGPVIITEVDLALTPTDPAALRRRLKEVMAAKKASQPLGERSAGCVFKNPTVGGERVSAGRLIDEAGCKAERIGSATVSPVHANFITAVRGGSARDVLTLIERVRDRVAERHGVELEREIVVWRRGEDP